MPDDHSDDGAKRPLWIVFRDWIWKLLNSPIVLLLLSSFVIAHIADRHVKQEAEAARQGAELSARSLLRIELAHRADEIRSNIDKLVNMAEARSGKTVRVGCENPSDPRFAEARKVEVDPVAPDEVTFRHAVDAAVTGTQPYIATSPAFANVHLLVLMTQVDENFHDPISSKPVVWTVPREAHPNSPFRAADAVRGLAESNMCSLIRNNELVQRYELIRRAGDCQRNPEAGNYLCRLDLPKYAGWE